MIETNIGQIALQPNQLARLSTLHDSNIHGFFIDANGVVVKSDGPINNAAVAASLSALDNSALQAEADKLEFSTSVFKNLTPQQADDWIAANVTNISTAIVALRRIVRVLMYLIRRSDLGQ